MNNLVAVVRMPLHARQEPFGIHTPLSGGAAGLSNARSIIFKCPNHLPRFLKRDSFYLREKLFGGLTLFAGEGGRAFHAAEGGLWFDARRFAVDSDEARLDFAGEAQGVSEIGGEQRGGKAEGGVVGGGEGGVESPGRALPPEPGRRLPPCAIIIFGVTPPKTVGST